MQKKFTFQLIGCLAVAALAGAALPAAESLAQGLVAPLALPGASPLAPPALRLCRSRSACHQHCGAGSTPYSPSC